MSEKMDIVFKKLDEIKPYEKNPRKNDKAVKFVAESIKQFGFKVPIITDKDGVIVCGHTRYKAAKRLKLKEVPVICAEDLTPEQVKAFRVADNKVSEQAEWDFDILSDELLELKGFDFDMAEFGFDDIPDEKKEEKKEEKEKETAPEEKDTEEDDIPEVDKSHKAKTQIGDIWQLGNHRLMCGDSTDALNLGILMDGKRADLVFTDPPYGMKKESEGIANDNLNYSKLLEFNKQWIPLTFEALKDNGSWYCWGIDEPLMDIYSDILKPMKERNEITFRNLLTWDKGSGQGQLQDTIRMYAPVDEKCLFVMKGVQTFDVNSGNYYEGWEPLRSYLFNEWRKISSENDWNKRLGHNMGAHYFAISQWTFPTQEKYEQLQELGKEVGAFQKEYGELRKQYESIKKGFEKEKQEWFKTRAYFNNMHDNMNNVWHFERTGKEERELTGGHATPKPLALCGRAIKSSSREGEIVLDVFGGSGSTLIACEQLDRSCYMIELDPFYCDVIIKRWEALTGSKAVLL